MTISLGSPHSLTADRVVWGYGSTATNTTLTALSGNVFPASINGYGVSGTGVPAGSTVVSGQGTSALVISAATTATASGINFVFTSPTLISQAGNGFQGQLVNEFSGNHIFSQVNDGSTAIDFGSFAAKSTVNTCKAPAADTDILIGLASRQFKASTVLSGTVTYNQYDTVGLVDEALDGIYCLAAENANKDDIAVSITAGGGTVGARSLTNANGKAIVGTPAFTGTGNGTLTMDTTAPLQSNYQDGTYTVKCITAATNNGTFRVFDPLGNSLGDSVMASGSGTFTTQIKFALADGSTDFIVGDYFTIAINAGRVAANGKNGNIRAVWMDSVVSGSIGRVKVQAL